MLVREILEQRVSHTVSTISHMDSVFSAAKLMTNRNIGALAVLNHNRLVGVVSERDILNKVVSKDVDPHRVTVGEIMSTNLIVAGPDDTFEECEEKMRRAHCRHIFIVDSNKLVSMISLRDILDLSSVERHGPVIIEDEAVWSFQSRQDTG